MLKWNHSITTRNYAVTYYQNLEDVPGTLHLMHLKKWQKFSKSLEKILKIKNLHFSGRLFVSSWKRGVHRGGGGGGLMEC